MKSDTIRITGNGKGVPEALAQAEKVAAFLSLSPKEAIHLRLLAEEMLGMFSSILEDVRGEFWIEDTEKDCTLHLRAWTFMNAEKRRKLLSVSTTGGNAAAKGVMGKLRDLLIRSIEPMDEGMPIWFDDGWFREDAGIPGAGVMMPNVWSLNRYRNSIGKEGSNSAEKWDELERSIVARLADEVEIFLRADEAEMVIHKRFSA